MRAMDNFAFFMRAYEEGDLRNAIKLVMGEHHAVSWVEKDYKLSFLWSSVSDDKAQDFPVPLPPEAVADIVLEWLDYAEYDLEPDIDGSCSKGFEIEGPPDNEDTYIIFSVKTCWAHHHK